MKARAAIRRRTAFALAAALLAAAFLAGCPLASDKPLSDPGSAAPDPTLFGTWRTVDPETGEANVLRILAFNSHEMVAVAPETDPGKTSVMRMVPTKVGDQTFLSIQELGSGDSGWFLANYRVENDALRMKIVDDGLFKDRTFATSEQLRTFIRQNLSDPRLYAASNEKPSEMVLTRVPEAPEGSGPKS